MMVRDLHARKKLMREMDRRGAAAAERRRQQHNRTLDSLRALHSQLTAASQSDRPHTPTPSQSQRQVLPHFRPVLGQTPNSTMKVVHVDEGDEQRPEQQETGDILRTMQPVNPGELTALQAVTTNAVSPLRAREHRAATVNYGSNAALAIQPPVVADLAASNVFSQTLQMPLSCEGTAPMYHTATASGEERVSTVGQQGQRPMSASSTALPHSIPGVPVRVGRTGRSQSLHLSLFRLNRAALMAVERHAIASVAFRHRRASSEQSTHASRQQISPTITASHLHVTNDNALPAVINYSTPNISQQRSGRAASHLDLVHEVDVHRSDSSSENHIVKAITAAANQPPPGTTSLRSSTPSTVSTSFTQSVSTSTPFPLSALEMAALSSQLIFHRCAHEVKKLLDTNLYLSFIRQSAEFRRFRLQRRKEEREAALATRRQVMAASTEKREDSQAVATGAVQILVISHSASEAAAEDEKPAS